MNFIKFLLSMILLIILIPFLVLASPAFLITFLLSAINKERKPKTEYRPDEDLQNTLE